MPTGVPDNVVLGPPTVNPKGVPPNVVLGGLPTDPTKLPARIEPPPPSEGGMKTIGRQIPRVGAQVAGAQIGGALGGGAAMVMDQPELAPTFSNVGATVGAGVGNVIGKHFPTWLGGDPTESTLHAFGWGAGPEALARGTSSLIEKKVASKTAEDSYKKVLSALDKGANPPAAEQAGRLAETLGRTTLKAPEVMTGDALSSATNSLRQDIQEPITTMRQRLGEPIGAAYKNLKADPTPLDPKDITDLQEAAANVKDSMISRYPKAKAILQRIKNLSPPEPPEWAKPDYQGDHAPRPVTTQDYEELNKYSEAVKNYKPPTWDDIRELRQANNEGLRAAKGGDKHAMGGLQQAIDQKFMDSGKLPADIDELRSAYRAFMNRFPWQDVNRIDRLGTPRELGQYVFGGTPERTAEIIKEASPEGKVALKEALTNRVLDAVNPDQPLAEQIKAARDALAPYVKNGAAASLYGAKNADEIRNIFYLPEHIQQWKDVVQTDEFHEGMVKEVTKLVRSGKTDAVERGWQKMLQSLPPKTRALFENPTLPGAELPVLPSTQEAMASGMRPGQSNVGGRLARRAEMTAPFAVGRAFYSPIFAGAQLATFAGIMGTSAGYRALMENGGASLTAKMFANPVGRATPRVLLETLAAIGTATERKATQPSAQNQ